MLVKLAPCGLFYGSLYHYTSVSILKPPLQADNLLIICTFYNGSVCGTEAKHGLDSGYVWNVTLIDLLSRRHWSVLFLFRSSVGLTWHVEGISRWWLSQYEDVVLPVCDRVIFNMGIPYLRKTAFILRRGPGGHYPDYCPCCLQMP